MTETNRIVTEIASAGQPNTLYRFYAPDGALLYIGITKDLGTRLKAHNRQKDWFVEVADVKLEHFPSRDAVEAAERAAIANENPRWNIVHKRSKGVTLDEVVRAWEAIELAVENYRRVLRNSLASGVVLQSEVANALGRTREMIRLDAMSEADRQVLTSKANERRRKLRSVA